MSLHESRAFRLTISAIGAAGLMVALIGGLIWISNEAHGSVSLDETPPPPRLSSPAEIAQAALDGQVEALRKEGFTQKCLLDVEISGERCIERCVPKGSGFYLAIAIEHPVCQVVGCSCEGEELELEPEFESQSAPLFSEDCGVEA